MIVVHHLIIGRSVFTVWLLEELGVEYELEIYHRQPDRRAPPELRSIHPLGKSPVIVDDGVVIAESGAIATHLLETHDQDARLHRPPGHPQRTEFLQWLHYPEGSAFLPLFLRMMQATAGSLGELVDGFTDGEVSLHLGYLSAALEGKRYILGEDFCAADVALAYIVSLAERLEQLAGYPTLQEYLDRCRSRPAWQRAFERSGG